MKFYLKQNFLLKFLVLIISISLTIITIIFSKGFAWPDEIFQTLEPANHFLTGRGHLSWEFHFKARSFFYPYILSFALYILNIFFSSPSEIYYSFRIILGFLFSYSVYTAYLICTKNLEDKKELYSKTLFFILIWVFTPIFYYFGFRTLTESISTIIIFIIILKLEYNTEKLNKTNIFFYSILLSLCYGIRFQTGFLFLVFYPLFIIKLIINKKEELIFNFILAAFLGLILYGLSDFLYYKIPFISTYNYYELNIIKKISYNWGTSPFYFYIQEYFKYLNILILFSLIGIYYEFKKQFPIILSLLFYILIHSYIAHKELRFIYLSFPFLVFFAVNGIWSIYKKTNFKKSLLLAICIISLLINYKSFKKINWNFANSNLEIFFNISEEKNIKGNLLVAVHDDFAFFPGYVYIGNNFQGELFYKNILFLKDNKIINFIRKEKVKYILIQRENADKVCIKFKFCKKITENQEYMVLKN